MRLTYRIAAGFLVLLAVLIGPAVYHLTVIHRLQGHVTDLARPTVELAQATQRLEEALGELDRLTRKLQPYSVEGDPTEALRAVKEWRQVIEKEIEEIWQLAASEDQRQPVREFLELWEGYRRRAEPLERRLTALALGASQGAAQTEGGLPGAAQLTVLRDDIIAISQQLPKIEAVFEEAIEGRVTEIEAESERAELVAQIAALLALAGALTASVLVSASIVRPLGRLARGTRELAGGKFSFRVEPSGGPELKALAEDFNAMAERLSVLDQLKKDLVSDVSHDLKAPLASMQETTRLLLERLPGPLTEKQQRLLEMNLRCGNRLSKMIADLLDLSRLENRSEQLPRRPEDLRQLVATALDELESTFLERAVQVCRDLPPEPLFVDCHAPSILQLLQNLVSNGVKYSPAGGSLGVRLSDLSLPKGSWWRRPPELVKRPLPEDLREGILLEVWDSGPGVPDPHKEEIFDRFHRLNGEHRLSQGAGLGLAIAREVTSRHGGLIWVEDHPGGGSSFRVVLPRHPEGPPAATAAPKRGASSENTDRPRRPPNEKEPRRLLEASRH